MAPACIGWTRYSNLCASPPPTSEERHTTAAERSALPHVDSRVAPSGWKGQRFAGDVQSFIPGVVPAATAASLLMHVERPHGKAQSLSAHYVWTATERGDA